MSHPNGFDLANHELHRLAPLRPVMQNSLWNHDYLPDLPDLEPYSTLEIGRFPGPGIIRTIHLTLNIENVDRRYLLEEVYVRISYNGQPYPSVDAPVGDFFCDSFGGLSTPYASSVMAKRPTNSWFCYLPIAFQQEVVVELVNQTDQRVTGYGYITAETLQKWEDDLAYLHPRG